MIGVEISPQNIAPTLKAIKQLEPDTIKALKKDIGSKLGSVMSQIQSNIPEAAPLSGMKNRGRLRWTKPRVSISLTPATKLKGRDYHPLVSFSISGAAFKMTELAGIRGKYARDNRTPNYSNRWGTSQSHQVTTQGRYMVQTLQQRYPIKGKGGRFAWDAYIRIQDDVAGVVLEILDAFVTDFNRRWGI